MKNILMEKKKKQTIVPTCSSSYLEFKDLNLKLSNTLLMSHEELNDDHILFVEISWTQQDIKLS